jgi:hypothetical protein
MISIFALLMPTALAAASQEGWRTPSSAQLGRRYHR